MVQHILAKYFVWQNEPKACMLSIHEHRMDRHGYGEQLCGPHKNYQLISLDLVGTKTKDVCAQPLSNKKQHISKALLNLDVDEVIFGFGVQTIIIH